MYLLACWLFYICAVEPLEEINLSLKPKKSVLHMMSVVKISSLSFYSLSPCGVSRVIDRPPLVTKFRYFSNCQVPILSFYE